MSRSIVLVLISIIFCVPIKAQVFYSADSLRLNLSAPNADSEVAARLLPSTIQHTEYMELAYAKTNLQLVSFQNTDRKRKAQAYLGLGNLSAIKLGGEYYFNTNILKKITLDFDAADGRLRSQNHSLLNANAEGELRLNKSTTTYTVNLGRWRVNPYGIGPTIFVPAINISKLVNAMASVNLKTNYGGFQDSILDNAVVARFSVLNQRDITEVSTEIKVPYTLSTTKSNIQIQPNFTAQIKSANTANNNLYAAQNLGVGIRLGALKNNFKHQYFAGAKAMWQNNLLYILPDFGYVNTDKNNARQFTAGVQGNTNVNSGYAIIQSVPMYNLTSNAPNSRSISYYVNYSSRINKSSSGSIGLSHNRWSNFAQLHNPINDNNTFGTNAEVVAIIRPNHEGILPNFQAHLSYQYMLTETFQAGINAQTFLPIGSFFAFNVPLYNASFFASYLGKGWHVKPVLQLRGKMEDIVRAPNGDKRYSIEIPAATDFSFSLEKNIKKDWHLGCNVLNLFDSNYEVFSGYQNYGLRALLFVRKDFY
jgi:hypothetical protein